MVTRLYACISELLRGAIYANSHGESIVADCAENVISNRELRATTLSLVPLNPLANTHTSQTILGALFDERATRGVGAAVIDAQSTSDSEGCLFVLCSGDVSSQDSGVKAAS
jgi:hypothetical protein